MVERDVGGAVTVERSRLVVYTVEGGGGGGEGLGVAPCNRSVTAKMDEGAAPGGLSWKRCAAAASPSPACASAPPTLLDGCRRRGWRAKNIFTGASAAAAEAARLRRTPHASPQLAGADYTVLADAADGREAALNRRCSTASMPCSPAPPRRSPSTTPAAAAAASSWWCVG